MTLSEAKVLLRAWDAMEINRRGRATYSRANNVYHHFDAHGGRSSLEAYMRDAATFPRGRAWQRSRDDGTTIYHLRDGRFLIARTSDQRIVTYGENGPRIR